MDLHLVSFAQPQGFHHHGSIKFALLLLTLVRGLIMPGIRLTQVDRIGIVAAEVVIGNSCPGV